LNTDNVPNLDEIIKANGALYLNIIVEPFSKW
jgi:hypothetical protein